jgi:hypothetical protein
MLKHVVLLAGAVLVMACASGCGGGGGSSVTEFCPDLGQGYVALKTIMASGSTLRHSTPPDLFAQADGQSVKLVDGVSEWCGLVTDVFPPRVVTSDTPLVVRPGETIKIPNPLPGEHLFNSGVGLEAVRIEPTPESRHLLAWPSGPGGGGSAANAKYAFRFDDNGMTFVVDEPPGRYVVKVRVEYPRIGANSPKRRANYTLLIEVKE